MRFLDAPGDIPASYFIIVEQQLLLKCRSIQSAEFFMFSHVLCFQCVKVKNVLYFIQDRDLGLYVLIQLSSLYCITSGAIDLYLVP